MRQDEIVDELGQLFDRNNVVDRRRKPSHGYRAVHVVPEFGDAAIELQVRTELQHRWAELSEKLSDVFDHSIKCGGGRDDIRVPLLEASEEIANIEGLEPRIARLQASVSTFPPEIRVELENISRNVLESKTKAHEKLDDLYASIRQLGEGKL